MLQLRIGHLCIRVWFRVVNKFAVDGPIVISFLNQNVPKIFSMEGIVVFWHSHPVAIVYPPEHWCNATAAVGTLVEEITKGDEETTLIRVVKQGVV